MEQKSKWKEFLEALGEIVIAIISFAIGIIIIGMVDSSKIERFVAENFELTILIGCVVLLVLYGIIRLFVWLIKRLFSRK